MIFRSADVICTVIERVIVGNGVFDDFRKCKTTSEMRSSDPEENLEENQKFVHSNYLNRDSESELSENFELKSSGQFGIGIDSVE